MKISLIQTVIAVIFAGISLAHDISAQELLNRKLYLKSENKPIKALLSDIEKAARVKFTYRPKLFSMNQTITFQADNERLKEVLIRLLKPMNISWEILGNQIILKKAVIEDFSSLKETIPFNLSDIKIAEQKISGKVTSVKGEALIGTTVLLNYQNKNQIADIDGSFLFTGIPNGTYILTFSSVGFKTLKKEVIINGSDARIDVVLQEDNLQLDQVVVTASGSPKKKIESSVAISTLSAKQLSQRPPLNSMDVLKAIPGLSVESSGGDGPGSVRVRGLPSGGFVFMGAMEDGLPLLPTGYSGNPAADQLYKIDLTIKNIEVVRGGNASILLANTPGALMNVISNTGGDKLAGKVKYTRGLSQNANRFDFNIGGPLAPKLKFNVGGFYRADDGIKPASYRGNEGGQLKLNLTYQFKPNSYIRFYGKYLNDKVAWLVPSYYSYDGSGQGRALPYFDPLTQTLAPSDTRVSLTHANGQTYNFDLSDGYHTKLLSGGLEVKHVTGNEWTIKNNLRYQRTDVVYNFSLVSAPIAFNSANKYYYLDGTQLINPTGLYTGQSATGTTSTDNQFVDILDINKQIGRNSLSFGVGIHTYDLDMFWINANTNTELKDKPRILLVNTATGNGFTGTNISAYRKGLTTISSAWVSDEINLNRLTLDLGVRVDKFHVKGQRLINTAPFTNYTPFDENNTYASTSVGLNYKINEQHAFFGRATQTYSALNIGDYSSFTFNPEAVKDRSITMAEVGYKVNTAKFALFSSLVYAKLANISALMLIPNTSGGFINMTTFASSRNLSAEIEATYAPTKNLNFRLVTTFQNSQYTDFSVTAPSTARADLAGKPFSWSGNSPERIPNVIWELSTTYSYKIFDAFVSFRHIGKRWSSQANLYRMGGYDELSAGLDIKLSKALGLRVWGDNLLNSRGLTEGNIRGDQFLQNGNFEQGSPQIGRIILPRSLWASVALSF